MRVGLVRRWKEHVFPHKQLIQDDIVVMIKQMIVVLVIGGLSEMNLGVQIHHCDTMFVAITVPR
jgi:hypothetical protein